MSQTLDAVLPKGRTMPEKNRFPAVLQPITVRESGQGYWMEDDKAGTLRAEGENRPSRPSRPSHAIVEQPMAVRRLTQLDAWAFKPSHYTRRGSSGAPNEVVATLSAEAHRGDQDTLIAVRRSVASTRNPNERVEAQAFDPYNLSVTNLAATLGINAGISTGRNGVVEPIPLNLRNATHDPERKDKQNRQGLGVATPYAVRRLTPVECERLQGFPDRYTAIPWKGKLSSECPDGPRYKAIGNSMAVPVMAWIGRRIAAVQGGGL